MATDGPTYLSFTLEAYKSYTTCTFPIKKIHIKGAKHVPLMVPLQKQGVCYLVLVHSLVPLFLSVYTVYLSLLD